MMATTAITNVRVLTGAGLTEPTTVHLADGMIVERADGATVVDGAGRTLLPGLIDAHMHVLSLDDLRGLARWGVTTGLDMGTWSRGLVAAVRGATGAADLRSATVPAIGPEGNHARMPGFPVAEGVVTTPEQARTFVEHRVRDGADYVKIVSEAGPPAGMDQATTDAIVTAARGHGLKVVAHAVTVGAVHVAVDAGVDVITHVPLDAVLDDATVRRMADARTVCVPTLTMMQATARVFTGHGLSYDAARDTVTAMHRSGVPIAVGTDANSAPGAPAAPRHGESMHHELTLLVEAGLSPLDVLDGASALTARTFGLDDRGVVAPGRRADLLLVDGDPTTDVTVTRRIAGVWVAGERVR